MAGGEHARIVACFHCGARAERTHEGLEDDRYACAEGHSFGIDWSYDGPPSEPQWPAPAGFRSMQEIAAACRGGRG